MKLDSPEMICPLQSLGIEPNSPLYARIVAGYIELIALSISEGRVFKPAASQSQNCAYKFDGEGWSFELFVL